MGDLSCKEQTGKGLMKGARVPRLGGQRFRRKIDKGACYLAPSHCLCSGYGGIRHQIWSPACSRYGIQKDMCGK